ncbi:hypothetical protein MPSEU_001013300 [Mayamaea pseudoterrestris]|nr:hypothetical protein MPSEU_001013300 [Mayamaea pseudoterrestris]
MPRHNKKQKKSVAKPPPADLNRFAGSSEEEDNDDLDIVDNVEKSDAPIRVDYAADAEETDEESDEGSTNDKIQPKGRRTEKVQQKDEAPHDDGSSEDDTDDDDESDANTNATMGMAGAMARILGTQPTKAPSVVLSKTKTPLQKQAELEKQREKELKEKKQVNRERNLAALHIPLSVATSASSVQSVTSGLQAELQQERAHRRIATRGVVALFNAIAQHQNGQGLSNEKQQTSSAAGNKKDLPAAKMTKNSFLDLIKSKAKAAAGTNSDLAPPATSDKKQWNAFRDDYMLDTKTPDWEKEDESSLDGAVDQDGVLSDDSDHECEQQAVPKRRKVRT